MSTNKSLRKARHIAYERKQEEKGKNVAVYKGMAELVDAESVTLIERLSIMT